MQKFATLDPKFFNISIAKNKVPWVDKLFQDIKNKLKTRVVREDNIARRRQPYVNSNNK